MVWAYFKNQHPYNSKDFEEQVKEEHPRRRRRRRTRLI